jgi:pseudoazurin
MSAVSSNNKPIICAAKVGPTKEDKMKTSLKTILIVVGFMGATSISAAAAEHIINMKNKGADGTAMVFEPSFVRAAVGDTVKFVPVDKGHFAVDLPGMWPEGVEKVKGKMNTEFVVTFAKDGLYGFKCTPHYAMGMVALVQVGTAPVTDAVKAIKLPSAAGKRMEAALALAAAP